MLNVYPPLKTAPYIHFNVALIVILAGCAFMVQTYPFLWILVAICGVLAGPLVVELVSIPAIVVIVIFDVFYSLKNKKPYTHSMQVVYLKRKVMMQIQSFYSRLPLGSYNVYELGLAGMVTSFANSMGSAGKIANSNALVSSPMLPLYEQAQALLDRVKIAENSDKALIHVLLARELYFAGKETLALQNLSKAADLYEALSDKERNEVARIPLLLVDCFIGIKSADKKKGLEIALQTLSMIENSAVNTQPNEQLKTLEYALNLVAKAYQACGENELAKPFAERDEALTAALHTKGLAI